MPRTCSGSRPRRSATRATATPSSTTSPTRPGCGSRCCPGEDEARLTFLAVRRWFGWSAGRLAVFDIGGGSLEIAGGADEEPDVAWSMPLGRGPAGARLLQRRAARTRAASGRCARRSAPTSPRTPATCCGAGHPTSRRRRPRRSGRWPASAARRPVERRTAGRPGTLRSTTCRGGSRSLVGDGSRATSPPCPASRRVAPTRSCPVRSSPRR